MYHTGSEDPIPLPAAPGREITAILTFAPLYAVYVPMPASPLFQGLALYPCPPSRKILTSK